MSPLLGTFLGMLTLVFAICSFIAGIFTAYFGSGKSRAVGLILVVLAIIVGFIFYYGMAMVATPWWNSAIVVTAVVAVVGALVGGAIALGVFLAAIMKA
jgi:uncharacterized membrane protein YbjE (DUF340 family)